MTMSYDSVGNEVSVTSKNLYADVQSVTRTYDLNSNPVTEMDMRHFNKTFTYDALDRLTAMDGSGGGTFARTYAYDAVGNRTFAIDQGSIETTHNLAGEITSMVRLGGNQVTHTYDLNGNITVSHGLQLKVGNARVTMAYDKENRQIVHTIGTTVTSYTYSGDGLKRSEITGSGRTTMIWDGSEYLAVVVVYSEFWPGQLLERSRGAWWRRTGDPSLNSRVLKLIWVGSPLAVFKPVIVTSYSAFSV